MGISKAQYDELYSHINDGTLTGKDAEDAAQLLADFEDQQGPSLEADTSPFKAPSYLVDGGVDPKTGQPAPKKDLYPQKLREAAAAGVDVTSGSDFATQFNSSIPNHPEESMNYLRQKLNTDVRMGPQSGAFEYLNPKTRRWTLVNGGASLGPVASGITFNAPTVIGGAAGTAIGALSGNPGLAGVGSVMGTTMGAGVSATLRNAYGKWAGIIPQEESIFRDYPEALDAGIADAATLGTLGLLRWGRNSIKGALPFTAKEAAELAGEQARADALIREIQANGGAGFDPTIAQIAIAPNSAIRATREGQLAASVQSDIQGVRGVREQLTAKQVQNQQALYNYFDNLFKQDVKQGTGNVDVAGALADPFNKAMAAAKEVISKLPSEVPQEQTAGIIRTALLAAKKNYKETVERPAWAAYESAIGFNKQQAASHVKIPLSKEIMDLMGQWSNEEKKALLNIANSQNSRLSLNIASDEVQGDAKFVTDWGMRDTKQVPVDLAQVNSTIKWLRSEERRSMSNQQGVVLSNQKLDELERKLAGMRDEYLAKYKPDIKTLQDAAENASAEGSKKFKSGVVNTMLVHDASGGLRLTDSEALMRMMQSGDKEALTKLADLVKIDPNAKNQMNQMVLALYKQAVVNPRTGVPNITAHGNFMKKYGAVMNAFFTKGELPEIYKVGGLSRVVLKEKQFLDSVANKASYKGFYGEDGVAAFNPQGLTTQFFDKSASPEKVAATVSALNKYPYGKDTIASWRDSVLSELKIQLTKDGHIDPTKLNSFLKGTSEVEMGNKARALEILLNADGSGSGTVAIRGLAKLREALGMLRDIQVAGPGNPQMGMIQKGIRQAAKPFSSEGRLLTYMQSLRKKANPEVVYRALTDRQAMLDLTKQSDTLITQIKALTGISNVDSAMDTYDR